MGRFPEGFGVLAAFGVLLCALLVGLFALPAFQEPPLTGQATHGTYNAFSAPEQGFRVENGLAFVADTAIYKHAWYSVNGSAWQSFTLSGPSYRASASWLFASGFFRLPAALSSPGEHYVIIYSCSRVADVWDCHGDTPATGGWQLMVITISDDSCGGIVCGAGEYCSNDACLLRVPGKTYFVAVEGNDSFPGNFTHPFATWQKAVDVSLPGDITYIRGGIYRPTTHIMRGSYETGTVGMIIDSQNSGTAEAPIRYFAYPPDWNAGDFPILDGDLVGPNVATGWNIGIDINNVQYLQFKGLTLRHIHQGPPDFARVDKPYSEVVGIAGSSSANLLYENVVVHDVDGRAFQHWSGAWNEADGTGAPFESDNTAWINCDAYNLFDGIGPTPGNGADGWISTGYYGNLLSWEGCRAFNYSDDGFNPNGNAYHVFKDCWAMSSYKYENLSPDWNIEGNGYKLPAVGNSTPQYVLGEKNFYKVENSIAAYCTGGGFVNNLFVDYKDAMPNNNLFSNNLAYRNGNGFFDFGYEGGPRTTVYRNNVAYGSTNTGWGMNPLYEVGIFRPSIYPHSNNTWIGTNCAGDDCWPGWRYNPAFNLTDEDFVSLDATQLMRPRKADGSLPDIEFGHLAPGSDLIDGGTLIPGYHCATAGAHPGEGCRVWYGIAPDLGPFEYTG